jgi:ABC-type spermidine/putrescine transport system permease subunit I
MNRPLVAWTLAAPAAALLALGLVAPLLLLVRVSLSQEAGPVGRFESDTWTLAAYSTLLGDPLVRSIWWLTAKVSLLITALTLAIAYPVALLLRRLSPRIKMLALIAIVLPKLANMLVIVYGLKALLGNEGPVNRLLLALGATQAPIAFYPNLLGVVIGETYLVLPYALVVLTIGLEKIDRDLEDAARGLGASPGQVLWRVTLPLSLPALFTAAQLCLAWTFGMLVGPLLLGGPDEYTLGVEVQRLTLERLSWPRGAAAAVLLLATLAACLVLLNALERRLRPGGMR